jgi:hypothetical protein
MSSRGNDRQSGSSVLAAGNFINWWHYSRLEQLIAKGVDVLPVEGTDPPSVAPHAEESTAERDQSDHVDCDESKDSRDFFINQVTDRDFGYALVGAMAQALGGETPEGKVAVETTYLTPIDQKS